MCHASVYMETGNETQLIMKDIDFFESFSDHIRLVDISGQEKRLKARIKRLCLVDHKIFIEPIEMKE